MNLIIIIFKVIAWKNHSSVW